MTTSVDAAGVASRVPNPEIMRKWAEELESGKYTQGGGALRIADAGVTKHCCLGVLCDLAVEAGVIPEPYIFNGEAQYGVIRNGGTLPEEVQEWAGFDESDPSPDVTFAGLTYEAWDYDADRFLEKTIKTASFSALNDSRGQSFGDIAAIIRENYCA